MEQTQTYPAARGRIAVVATITGFGTYFLLSEGKPLGALFFGALTLMLAVVLLRGQGSITLDRKGIHWVQAFRTRTWRWQDVGPFSMDSQRIGIGFLAPVNRYACAFSKERHSTLAAHGKTMRPTYKNADIIILLKLNKAGRSKAAALEFVDQANRMREMFGGPDIQIRQRNERAAAEMERAVKLRSVWFWAKVAFGVIVLLPIFVLIK